MKKVKWNKKSIISFFTTFTVVLVLLQTILLSSLLIFGGAFRQARISAYESFDNIISSRSNYLGQDIKNRWTNLDPYLLDIRQDLSHSDNSSNEMFQAIIDDLIQVLRDTETTGVFLILEDTIDHQNIHSSLYLRDYDPSSNSTKNDDISMVVGPSELAKKYKLPLDYNWQYNLTLTDENRAFYEEPLKYTDTTMNQSYLGYWSRPFKLHDKDNTPIITYSMPIQNIDNETIGVIGVELSINYLVKFLPASDIQLKDSLGYIIAAKDPEDDTLKTMITTNNIQKRFINLNQPLQFEKIPDDNEVYAFQNSTMYEDIHASISKLNLYPYTSPFQDEEWYLIGFMRSDDLLSYVNRMINIINFSIVVSLIFGSLGGIFISRKMSKPVINLVNQVIKADKSQPLKLEAAGLLELDSLSRAIEQTNKLMLNSASRLSRIIEMVDLPIAAFEITDSSDQVFITGKFFEILAIDEEKQEQFTSKKNFKKSMEALFSTPEPDEENIFKMTYSGEDRWIKMKLNMSGTHSYGIIEDVTDEILEKKRITRERDLDWLTKLLNRKSFQSKYEEWYEKHLADNMEKKAALIMFDLDFLKTINDTYGHKWGDYYIIEASKQLQKIADPEQYIIARRSGDEFIMLLHGFNQRDDIRHLLRQFYQSLAAHRLDFPDEKREIKISAGFVWVDKQEFNYEQLLHYADEALYDSKQNNKGYFTEKEI